MTERSIFLAVLDIADPAERNAYLDRACAGDAALRVQVEQLLKAHDEPGCFMERPAAGLVTTAADPLTERPGTLIGPYKLMEQIGEGGMGLVFVAEQQHPVRRKVALKLIKPGMDTKQVVARFEAERQALALMDHPNIAKVLDGGTTGGEPGGVSPGRPYFVMELVKGVPITQFCDDNRLGTRQRLGLFADVCAALQHAHQKGIIHRDLKPSNVLVMSHDGTPVVRVIDFGVAKAIGQQLTDKTVYTQFAQLIGTPLYMSPEQAGESGVDVDTRSDIYSLGVLLYELLTGTTPFDRERFQKVGYDEMRRIIREEEPPRPSTRLSTLGEAATTICAQRQTDPRRLRQLVRRELDWVVMKALEKDRNRRYESASAFAADVRRYLDDEPVQACPPSAWYRWRKFARRNKVRLTLAAVVALALLLVLGAVAGSIGWVARDEAARREKAEEQALEALAEADRLLLHEQWPEALTFIARAEAALGGPGGGELLARAARLRGHVQMVRSLDDARLQMAAAKEGRFHLQACDAAYAKAFKEYRLDLDGPDPQDIAGRIAQSPIRRQLTAALDDWAYLRRYGLQAAGWQRRLALARLADPDARRNRLRDAFDGDRRPVEEVLRAGSADDWPAPTLVTLANLARDTPLAERTAAVLRRAQRQHPGDFWINFHLALLYYSSQPRRLEDAVHYYGIAVALQPRSALTRSNLGMALTELGRLEDALTEYKIALTIEPNSVFVHNNLGWALYRQGKRDEAIAEYHKAVAIDAKIAQVHMNLGIALSDHGDLAQAAAEYAKVIDLEPRNADAHHNLGLTLWDQGKHGEATAEFHKAVECAPGYGWAHHDLGNGLQEQGKLDEAIDHYHKALGLGVDDARLHTNLGNALLRQGKLEPAAAAFRRAIQLDGKFAAPHLNLGSTLQQQGRIDEAVAQIHRAIALHPRWVEAYGNLGNALTEQGQFKEAGRAYRKALAIDPRFAPAHAGLARVLTLQGRLTEARDNDRRALQLMPERNPLRPLAVWHLQYVEHLLVRESDLPRVVKGQIQPAGVGERLWYAQLCALKQFPAAAARLYADALADPTLPDAQRHHRYSAACAAARAGCGQGKDAGRLREPERAALRRQALDWLRVELTTWGQVLEHQPGQVRTARQILGHWQHDPDLAGVRGDALARLPAAERQAWRQLWADVEQTLRKADRQQAPEATQPPK